MATIEKRSDSHGSLTYRVKVRMRGYPQATASFKRRTEAKHWAAQTVVRLMIRVWSVGEEIIMVKPMYLR